jgi:phosphohistidine phosphatase
MAGHLREQGLRPALVLCSTARRARETLEQIRPALAEDTEVRVERDLYDASAGDLLARVRGLPDALPSAMLIGHNPGIADLARTLAASGSELARLEHKFPTGALATLALRTSWREVGPGAAVLESFVRPKELG